MENIIIFIFGWFFIGFLFSLIKTYYWYKVLIKDHVASNHHDFSKTPFKIYFPICIIWTIQSLQWCFGRNDNRYGKETIPIIPISYQDHYIEEKDLYKRDRDSILEPRITKSNINYAIIKNHNGYYSYLDKMTIKFDKLKFIKEQFGMGILLGWFHLLFWVIGIICWIFIPLFIQINKFITAPIHEEQTV